MEWRGGFIGGTLIFFFPLWFCFPLWFFLLVRRLCNLLRITASGVVGSEEPSDHFGTLTSVSNYLKRLSPVRRSTLRSIPPSQSRPGVPINRTLQSYPV